MEAPGPSFGRLRTILACLLQDSEMGKSELQKLVYLMERESVLREGKLIVGFRFRHDKFGMYSPDLANAITDLETEGFLVARTVVADMGEGRKYRLASGASAPSDPTVKRLYEELMVERGKGGLSALIAYAKSTDPFVTTPPSHWVNWAAFIHEQCGGIHELLPEAEAELRALADRKPARVVSRDTAVKELESAG